MIVFKGTENGRDGNLYYQVGKIYVLKAYDRNSPPSEFKFYKDIADIEHTHVLDDPKTIIFQIEVPKNARILEEDSLEITVDRFEVVKALSKEEIKRISNGRIKFDENRRLIMIKHLNGEVKEYKYNEKGNVIYYRETRDNVERIYKCNDAGALIEGYGKVGNYWEITRYDNNGKKIYSENCLGNLYERRELENGHVLIYTKEVSGTWVKEEYDDQGRIIRVETSYGSIEEFMYDENGSLLMHKENGKPIYEIEIL